MSNGTVRILRHVHIEKYRKRLKKKNLSTKYWNSPSNQQNIKKLKHNVT